MRTPPVSKTSLRRACLPLRVPVRVLILRQQSSVGGPSISFKLRHTPQTPAYPSNSGIPLKLQHTPQTPAYPSNSVQQWRHTPPRHQARARAYTRSRRARTAGTARSAGPRSWRQPASLAASLYPSIKLDDGIQLPASLAASLVPILGITVASREAVDVLARQLGCGGTRALASRWP